MTNGLAGARVVNTRAPHQAAELDRLLRERGAIPLPYPCLAIAPAKDLTALDTELRDLLAGRYDWLILTSANAVDAVANRLAAMDRQIPKPAAFTIAAVGDATATAIAAQLAHPVAFISSERQATALAHELPIEPGMRVLVPASEIALPEPAATLRARGATVTTVVAYRTVTGSGGIDLAAALRNRKVEAIVFTSPSAIDGCWARLETDGGDPADLSSVAIVTIGPTTHRAAMSRGLSHAVMATTPSLDDIVATLDHIVQSPPVTSEGGAEWLSTPAVNA